MEIQEVFCGFDAHAKLWYIISVNKIHEKLKLVPDKPGVYLMRGTAAHNVHTEGGVVMRGGDAGNILYIGKAKSLINRLKSYFVSKSHDAKTTAMLSLVSDFEYFVCANEKDALGLEANLIKKHMPHYNILLKDNKSFPYIRVSTGEFPYLEVTRKLHQGGKYFGPYFNGIWARELLQVVEDIFGIRCCTGSLKKAKEPCINHQMEKCTAPCAGKINHAEYGKIVDNVKSFLRGEGDFGAREVLTEKMTRAAALDQFEIAIRYRNGLSFLNKLKERTITQVARDVNCDVFAYAVSADVFCVSVLTIRAGKLIGIQNFAATDNSPRGDDEKLAEFIAQYYLENVEPDEIVTAAQKGYKKKLVEMARDNAREYIETSIEKIAFKNQFTVGACTDLAQILGINVPAMGEVNTHSEQGAGVLRRIECYDISHMGGEDVVASMVVFIDGVAEPKLYRKFRIRHGLGNNDTQSMREVLTRRMRRLGSVDPSFGPAPDLIIVDGGKGQLSAACDVLCANPSIYSNIHVCAFSENNEIFVPDKVLALAQGSYALRLLQRVRDEAHRFAVGYQRTTRTKGLSHNRKKNRQ